MQSANLKKPVQDQKALQSSKQEDKKSSVAAPRAPMRVQVVTPPTQANLSSTLLKKLELVKQPLDFNNPDKQLKEKSDRLAIISELSQALSDQNLTNTVIVPNFEAIFQAIETSIFRPLPPDQQVGPAEDMQENRAEEPEPVWWPHVQPVYELLLQLVMNESLDHKLLKVVVSARFMTEYMTLFDAAYDREREYVKNILHRLYAKIVPRRKMIRKMVTDTFSSLIHERVKLNGCAELLDIMAAIISGFAVPLREEHIKFHNSVIVALHKVQSSTQFHQELLRCSMLFVSKDPSLAIDLMKGLLRFWPFANYQKETKFLQELYEVLDVVEVGKIEPILPQLFKQVTKCIASPHLQVADQALCFFENEFFLSLVRKYKNIALPTLVPVINHFADTHWHKLLQDSLCAVRQMLKDIDTSAFDKIIKNKESCGYSILESDVQNKSREAKEKQWGDLIRKAQQRVPGVSLPVAPYNPTILASDFNGLNNHDIILVD